MTESVRLLDNGSATGEAKGWPGGAGVFQVVGMFAMIASLTKNETDDKVIGYILKAINLLGFNIGAAKNDPAVK